MLYRSDVQHLYDIERIRISNPKGIRMRFHRLEKPDVWSVDLLDKIRSSMPLDILQQYPDYSPFYEKLANFLAVDKKNLVVGAGIEDLIRNLFMLCSGSDHVVVYPWPTCFMFKLYSDIFKVNAHIFIPNPWVKTEVQHLLDHLEPVKRHTKMVLLPNPGQPVENCFSLSELRALALYCHENDMVLVVDEAYYYFGAPTALPLIQEYDNLLVLRTFSKAFGAASIRLGCAIGQQRVLKPLEAVRQSGEVSGLSMHIASVLIDNFHSHVQPSIQAVCRGRDWLRDTIYEAMTLKTWGEVSNHVLVNFHAKDGRPLVNTICEDLGSNGIYVKSGFQSPLQDTMLITCGPIDLMKEFFEELRSAMAGELIR